MTHRPLGVFYADDATPCWAFSSRSKLKTILDSAGHGASEKKVNNALDVGGLRIAKDVVVREMGRAQYDNDFAPRLSAAALPEALRKLLRNERPDLGDLPPPASETRKCRACKIVKPLTTANFYQKRTTLDSECKECRRTSMNANNAVKRAALSKAFQCTECGTTVSSMKSVCNVCRSNGIITAAASVKMRAIGVFVDGELCWIFDSAKQFCKAMDISPTVFDFHMARNSTLTFDIASPYAIRFVDKHHLIRRPDTLRFTTADIAHAIKCGTRLY